MQRERIDAAIHRQLDRALAVLRCVDRSGGRDVWSHLFSHGHKFPTVRSLVSQGYLAEYRPYHYEMTDAGRQRMHDIDITAMAAR